MISFCMDIYGKNPFIDIYNDAPSQMVGLSTPSVGDQVTWVDFKDVKEERGEAGLLKK